jgi:membrane protein
VPPELLFSGSDDVRLNTVNTEQNNTGPASGPANGGGQADAPAAARKKTLKTEPVELVAGKLPPDADGMLNIARWLRRSVERPFSGAQAVGIVELAARAGHRVEITRMAAALTYRTIFSIIPVLVIALVFLGAFAKDNDIRGVVNRLLDFTGLSEIVLNPGPSPSEAGLSAEESFLSGPYASWGDAWAKPEDEAGAAGGGAGAVSIDPRDAQVLRSIAVGGTTAAPDAERVQRLDEWITTLVERVQGINFGAIGIIGLLTLIYAAVSMVVELEHSFNSICRAPSGKGWIRRIVQYWALLTLGPLMLVASFTVGEVFTSWVEHIALLDQFTAARQGLLTVLGFAITVLISTSILLVLFIVVPNTKVNVGPAIVGSLFAAILWELGKWGFTRYLHYSASYSKFYGSIAIIPLFMLWVYVTWIIVLTGLQLAYAVQTFRQGRQLALVGDHQGVLSLIWFLGPDRYVPPEPALVDPAAILLVTLAAGKRQLSGEAMSATQAADVTGVDERLVAEMLERLVGAGFMHRVEGPSGSRQYALARPASFIRAEDVLRLGQGLTPSPRTAEHAQAMSRLGEARIEAVRGQSLADLLGVRGEAAASEVPAVSVPAAVTSAAT